MQVINFVFGLTDNNSTALNHKKINQFYSINLYYYLYHYWAVVVSGYKSLFCKHTVEQKSLRVAWAGNYKLFQIGLI